MEMLWFFLPAIIILGVMTSYTDIKFGKIKNKHIILLLLYILIAYITLIFVGFLVGFTMRATYLFDLGINMLIALIFGFVAWHFRIWSAADAKLFFAYSGLVPLTAYSNTYFAYFPSFVILVNIFFPVFIYYVIKSIFFTSSREKISFIKKIKAGQIPSTVFGVFSSIWISRFLTIFIKIDIGLLGNILIMVSLFYLIRRIMVKMGMWRFAILLFLFGIILDYSYLFTLQFFWRFISFSIILIPMFFILMFSRILMIRFVEIKDLKTGTVLYDYIYYEKGKYKRMEEQEVTGSKIIKKESLLKMGDRAEGLTDEEVKKIKDLRKRGKLDFSSITVLQTLPFSPFLFLGVILTIIAGGNFLLLIKFLNI